MRIEEYHRGDVFFADLGSLDLGELYYREFEKKIEKTRKPTPLFILVNSLE
jgi:hypothetical protein